MENWKFYIAFSLFRSASIFAGVYHRWTMVFLFNMACHRDYFNFGDLSRLGFTFCRVMLQGVNVLNMLEKTPTILLIQPGHLFVRHMFFPINLHQVAPIFFI